MNLRTAFGKYRIRGNHNALEEINCYICVPINLILHPRHRDLELHQPINVRQDFRD